MGLSASMWTSVSGLLTHGERMSVVGNNIANVNTVAFKGSRMDFADYMSGYVGTSAGVGQVGRGVRVGIVMADFSNGSLETTTNATDVAITGNGFFRVKPMNSNVEYYTRAGNFLFDKNGYLTDPNGYVLQGWKVDQTSSQQISSGTIVTGSSGIVGSGVPQDIRLDTFTCDPRHTNNISTAVNLDSRAGNDKCQIEDDPFFSLWGTWDATHRNAKGEIEPLGANSYAWSNTITVFDEGGMAHNITTYYDRVEKTIFNDITGMEESHVIWEYIVTMDPSEDRRDFDGDGITLRGGNSPQAGLLMAGTLTFNSGGQLTDMTAYVPHVNTDSDMANQNSWIQAPLSNNGFPMFCPNFTGRQGASTAWEPTTTGTMPNNINTNTDGFLIEMNFGIRSATQNWMGNAPDAMSGWTTAPVGQSKEVRSDRAPGTLIPNIGLNGTQAGVVGTDGTVNLVYMSGDTLPPGTNAILNTTNNVYYEQKRVGVDSIGTGEAADSGFIYGQSGLTAPITVTTALGATVTLPAGTLIFEDSATTQIVYYEGEAFDVAGAPGATAITPAAGAITPVADLTRPVSSIRPQQIQPAVPVLRYAADGVTPLQLVTATYRSGMGAGFERLPTTSTSYTLNTTGTNFYEHHNFQDGYTYGDLRYINIDQDGVLSGTYSNGVTLQLFQITLYDFPSLQNLHREGNNLFTETRESGLPTSGAPGSGSFGKTESYSLEGSNVDLSRELVNMITTQRGFQANSKTITTVDTMLETVIGMKR